MTSVLVPSTVAPPDTPPDDRRVGHLLGALLRTGSAPRAVLVGFPCDDGVRRNGGRPGAAAGPAAIRQALYQLSPDGRDDAPFAELLGATRDLGDVAVRGQLESDQGSLAAALAPYLGHGTFAIVLGGGHETTFGHFLGYVEAIRPVQLLNWDAHPDVRPARDGKGHSGSPFRQALDHPAGLVRRYDVAGLQPHAVAPAHAELVQARGGTIWWRDELEGVESVPAVYAGLDTAALVSFDLDAVDQAYAPGVSAPNAGGLPVEVWLAAARAAGRHPAVTSCDVVELSPAHDRDGETARLAALTVWQILRGLAERDALRGAGRSPSGGTGTRSP